MDVLTYLWVCPFVKQGAKAMGSFFSSFSAPQAPPNVVLVPPLLDRERKGRSRFAKSSYDRCGAWPAKGQRRCLAPTPTLPRPAHCPTRLAVARGAPRLFAKPQLASLFGDYLSSNLTGVLLFTPPEDERISVLAKLAVPREKEGPALGAAWSSAVRCGPCMATALHSFVVVDTAAASHLQRVYTQARGLLRVQAA